MYFGAFGKRGECSRGAVGIDIAERDDILAGGAGVDVVHAAAAHADARNVELLVIGLVPQGFQRGDAAESAGWDGPRQQSAVEEAPS